MFPIMLQNSRLKKELLNRKGLIEFHFDLFHYYSFRFSSKGNPNKKIINNKTNTKTCSTNRTSQSQIFLKVCALSR